MTAPNPDEFLRTASERWAGTVRALRDADFYAWAPSRLRTYNVFTLDSPDWSAAPGVLVSTARVSLLATRDCVFYLRNGGLMSVTVAFSLAGTDPSFLVLPKDTTPEAAWGAFVAVATLCGDLV